MTEEKKTIQINPELFALSSRTRKKREPRDPNNAPIRVKNSGGGGGGGSKESNKTIRNRILKYIREQQEQNSKTHDLPGEFPKSGGHLSNGEEPDDAENDFESSLEFMKTFTEKAKQETIKNRQPVVNNVLYVPSITNSLLNPLPEHVLEMKPGETQTLHLKPAMPNMHRPVYGCMKGGELPTYKSWKNQTQRNPAANLSYQPRPPSSLENMTMTSLGNVGGMPTTASSAHAPSMSSPFPTQPMRNINTPRETINQLALMKEMQKRNEEMEKIKKNVVRKKQKKILRRTYRVGKSKKFPRVSVLISNKTIRRNITSKAYDMKQVPLEDVKKTLIRKGFIKAGSSAPVDVLRKMYETVGLMCGEVENHNPDYLLHNYLSSSF